MSRIATMLVALAAATPGCDADPRPACAETYQHLVTLARRNPDPESEAEFMEACVVARDLKRMACLTGAKTVGDALACKPKKKRPG